MIATKPIPYIILVIFRTLLSAFLAEFSAPFTEDNISAIELWIELPFDDLAKYCSGARYFPPFGKGIYFPWRGELPSSWFHISFGLSFVNSTHIRPSPTSSS